MSLPRLSTRGERANWRRRWPAPRVIAGEAPGKAGRVSGRRVCGRLHGFARPLPIAHGWVEDADGVVLDVAMPGEGAVYVAGARYIGQHALHVAHALRGVPFHARFPAGFLGRTTMFAAERWRWQGSGLPDVGPSAIDRAAAQSRTLAMNLEDAFLFTSSGPPGPGG